MAADAGGVCEVVTEETSVLLPNALTAELLGSALNGFMIVPHPIRDRVYGFIAKNRSSGSGRRITA